MNHEEQYKAVEKLSDEQLDALETELYDKEGLGTHWSSRRVTEYLYRAAVRRGWILGDA